MRVKRRDHWDEDDLELLERMAVEEATDNFWCYRQYIRPKMMIGWWQREVAAVLQRFYIQWMNNERPILALQSPPQHGKSKQVGDFISWVSGKHPDTSTIYASYSDRLVKRANLELQRTMDGTPFRKCFPNVKLSDTLSGRTPGRRYYRNTNILEFVGHEGSFRGTTVRGGVTGEGLNLGVVDDPIKGRAEASSEVIRDNTWLWLTDDFMTRFSDNAALLIILTRWHLDDPIGRLKEEYPHAQLFRYPALAEHDERHRMKGEPLFPELKSLSFLQSRKQIMAKASWESIYQQNPIIAGGDMFPVQNFNLIAARPDRHMVRRSVRYWDKAGTQDGGAWTAGVLMEELVVGGYCISDVVRGQWSANEREKRIKQVAQMDDDDRPTDVWVEQEPGSGGKESAERTVAGLAGHRIRSDRVTGDKVIRAEPYAAQVQGGNIALVAAPWNKAFIDEHEVFPNGPYKDQVDAAGGAFVKLTARRSTTTTGTMAGLH